MSSDGIMRGGGAFEFEIPYIDSVHFSQYPGVMAREAMIAGQAPPALNKPFVYCDMGCGTGATLLTLGASFPDSQFFGVDLSADHIAHAEAMRAEAGIENVTFFCGTFEDAANGTVPPCDFISAHGILSWIPEAVESELLSAVQTLLKPGGLFQMSVNLEAGWSQMSALRTIMRHGIALSKGTAEARLKRAISMAVTLANADNEFGQGNPKARFITETWREREAAYVGHEMLGGAWRLFTLSDVLRMAKGFGLECCGPLEFDSPEGQALTKVFASETDDYMVHEDFISFTKGESFRSLVFTKPTEEGFARDEMFVTGDDVVGFPVCARWTELAPAPDDEVSEWTQTFDTKPHYLTRIMAAAMSGQIPEHDIGAVAQMIGGALKTGNALIYATAEVEHDAEITPETPFEVTHPLTTQMLDKPRTYRFVGHVPSPVLGGGVQLTPAEAALLRVTLEGAPDRIAAARALIAEMDAKAPPWALDSGPRPLPDPAEVIESFDSETLPFLVDLDVIRPRA